MVKIQDRKRQTFQETEEYMLDSVTRTLKIFEQLTLPETLLEQNLFIIRPDECTDDEIKTFVKLVLSGQQVSEEGIEDRVRQCRYLGFYYQDTKLVGTSAIKQKSKASVQRTFRKAEIDREAHAMLELGYSVTDPAYRGPRYQQKH